MAKNRDNRAGSEQYFEFMTRTIKSYGTRARAQEVDLDSLTQLRELQRLLDEQTSEVVSALHEDGFSWSQIGGALGMDRSNAAKKYGSR
jgi:hypothetical protein